MQPIPISLNNARIQLRKLLLNAVERLIRNRKCGVLFSGGLDSSVLAKICQEFETEIVLYCTGFSNSKDLINARDAAAILELPLHTVQLELDEVEAALPKILRSLVKPTSMDLAIAIPLYFASQLAKKEGNVIVLCGQGADESLGGYKRYEAILDKEGYPGLHSCLQNDVLGLFRSLKREFAIAIVNHIEFEFPYLDRDVIQFLLQLPAEYKIRIENSTFIRKHILRLVAKDLGIPPQIYNRPKLAAQFGAGTQKALDQLAVKNGFIGHLPRKYEYSSRIQMYVDFLGYTAGVFIPKPRKQRIFRFIEENR